MMKRTKLLFSRVLRAGSRGKAMMLTVVVALTLATITPAFAANGGNFLLGRSNTASAVTSLIKSGVGPALQLVVPAGQPPMVVNATAGKATNLNADKLDGKDSTGFATGVGGKATDSDKLDGNDSTAFLGANARATDSDKLDGFDSNKLPGTIAAIQSFAGPVPSITLPTSGWVFAGPTVTVATDGNQKLVGSAEAPIGLVSGGTPLNFDYGLCYQNAAAGSSIDNFVGLAYSIGTITTTRTAFPAAASVTPSAGTWKVGFCLRSSSSGSISNNDFVNGWVQVVNNPVSTAALGAAKADSSSSGGDNIEERTAGADNKK
jgi:hypothetical protein